MWMYLPHYLSLHYYFVLICVLPTVFKCFQTTSKVSTLSVQLLYSLGAASCFLTGTQSVLVRGFLYNLRRFPSLRKFSFHSEASFQSFSVVDSQLKMHVCLQKELFCCSPFVTEGKCWFHKLSPVWSSIFQVHKVTLIKIMELELWIMNHVLFSGCSWMSDTIENNNRLSSRARQMLFKILHYI